MHENMTSSQRKDCLESPHLTGCLCFLLHAGALSMQGWYRGEYFVFQFDRKLTVCSWNGDWQMIQKNSGYPILLQSQRQPHRMCCVQMSRALLYTWVIKNWTKEPFSADGGAGGRESDKGQRPQQKLVSEVRTCVWESKSEQQFTHHLFLYQL